MLGNRQPPLLRLEGQNWYHGHLPWWKYISRLITLRTLDPVSVDCYHPVPVEQLPRCLSPVGILLRCSSTRGASTPCILQRKFCYNNGKGASPPGRWRFTNSLCSILLMCIHLNPGPGGCQQTSDDGVQRKPFAHESTFPFFIEIFMDIATAQDNYGINSTNNLDSATRRILTAGSSMYNNK